MDEVVHSFQMQLLALACGPHELARPKPLPEAQQERSSHETIPGPPLQQRHALKQSTQ